VGAPIRRKAPEKTFFGRAPPYFSSKSTISRFGERFRGGQYSLVAFLVAVLLYSQYPRAQPFVKVEGHVPPVPHGVGALCVHTPCCVQISATYRYPQHFQTWN